ncbi:MAG TPA: protein kinase [Gemmataceae bacterium]|nr:protein kinase [Gemmataceae bacterium]
MTQRVPTGSRPPCPSQGPELRRLRDNARRGESAPGVPLSPTTNLEPAAPARALLDRLLGLSLVESGSVCRVLSERGERLDDFDSDERFGQALVQAGLLTEYQLGRVLSGSTHGLVLGNYRVLERLGAGGMGVVFLAEHRLMRRRVAVKVLPVDDDCPPALRQRFYSEMRVQAELCHANVVLALEAGEVLPPGPDMPSLVYLVMELVDGGDLEDYVVRNGPCPVAEACDVVRQAACGLQAAHDRHLIHRDVKPSNVLRTPGGRIKLVDFGLVRQFCSRLTDPRALLGSVEFMPPEQSYDPSAVGKEADVYGLGATLFWLLTGEPPYPFQPHIGKALRLLQEQPPRRARALRPDVPPELDELVAQMLDRDPARRPASPLAVMNALAPFLFEDDKPEAGAARAPGAGRPARRALIVDDEVSVRLLHRMILEPLGCATVEVADGASALEMAAAGPFDLVLLDLNLPDLNGYEICRRLRETSADPHLKIIIVSGLGDQNDLAEALPRGADDYIPKPFEPRQMAAKVQHALHLRDAQSRARVLADQLHLTNQQLQQSLEARAADVRQAHNAILFTMARMAESRDGETPAHMARMRCYAEVLARQAALTPAWSGQVDARFLGQLDQCVPLHDIGKIGLPEEVLLKPAALSVAERALVQTHTLIGDRILEGLAREHGSALEFLGMARGIVRSHHERYDGKGYPDRLAGASIPAAARLVAVADVYDTLRRERAYKKALPHDEAVHILLRKSDGQFDPDLLKALAACHRELERVYGEIKE